MSRIKEYSSKMINYDIGQRLADLKSLTETQLENVGDEYMRGMANGMLLALSIMRDPYGADVAFVESNIDTLK